MPDTPDRVRLYLAAHPDLEDLVTIFRAITGREPTEADLQEAQALLAEPESPN